MFGAVLALLAGHAAEAAKRKAIAALFFAAAGALLLFALGFALASLRFWLIKTYDLGYPDLWIAGGLVVLCTLLVALGIWKQAQKSDPNALRAAVVVAAPAAVKVASRTISPQLIAIGAVVTIGIWLGRQLHKE